MDGQAFWEIVEMAATPAELHASLQALADEELVDFERLHAEFVDRAYTWELWGAVYVINGGCGDDTFEYFRSALIARGRNVYERAVAEPDSMADLEFGDDDEWEDWMSPTMYAVHARTGKYAFAAQRFTTPPAQPAGDEWQEEDLPTRFPRLAERYGS